MKHSTGLTRHENPGTWRLNDLVIRLTLGLLLSAVYPATPVFAGEIYYLSQSGLCNADDGVLEESDAIVLTDRSIGNHFFDCSFTRPIGKNLHKELWVKTEARCENETGSWTAEFEIVSHDDGSVNVFQKSGGLSPVHFYRCDD